MILIESVPLPPHHFCLHSIHFHFDLKRIDTHPLPSFLLTFLFHTFSYKLMFLIYATTSLRKVRRSTVSKEFRPKLSEMLPKNLDGCKRNISDVLGPQLYSTLGGRFYLIFANQRYLMSQKPLRK